MERKIIIDCDNTFSIDGCDIDDGLAIIYTLSQKDIKILGINTTFGNNTLDVVYPNTINFMESIGYSQIPVYRGSKDSYKNNEAAKFIVEMANRYNKKLSLVMLGSLTNLYHAWQIDNDVYKKIKDISVMGGIIEPLVINDTNLNELNFSCNHEATLNVLEYGENILIATGNTCLDAFFTKERFDKLKDGNYFEKWLHDQSEYWFDREKNMFKNKGIYMWDVIPVASLLNPHLFIRNTVEIHPDKDSIKTGLIMGNGNMIEVIIPKIKNTQEFIEHVYKQYEIFGEQNCF